MKKIIFDTNFAVIPIQFKVDVYSKIGEFMDEDYKICFPEICLKEIMKLKEGKASVDLMKQKKVRVVNFPIVKNVDNSLVEYAKKKNAVLATQDANLKKMAKKEGVRIITLRQKKKIELR